MLTILESLQKSVAFMQENFATKDDLKAFATKDDLKSFATKDDFFYLKEEVKDVKREVRSLKDEFLQHKSDIIAHIDGIVGMYKTVDLEVVALRSKYYRLESHVKQLAKHTHLALE